MYFEIAKPPTTRRAPRHTEKLLVYPHEITENENTALDDDGEGMWLALQQHKPDDYVLATGVAHSVREFVELAFSHAGIEIGWLGQGVDERGVDVRTMNPLVVIDPETGMVFDFFVSNDRIRPLYERLTFKRKELGPYPAYSMLGETVPTRMGDWHLYEIRYDRADDRVEWWIDRKLIAARGRIGAPDGMDGPIVKLRRPRVGGGLFTLLDDLNNDRVTADDNPKMPGFIRSNWEDRFDQGGQVLFRKFEIEGLN